MADNTPNPEGMNVNVNLDTTPVLYTDNVSLTINQDGLVMDFMQKLGPTNQLRIVARIGMSRDHAKKLYKVLGDQLKLVEGQVQTGKTIRN
ncbi:hypothetical protein M1555_05345 [Patescibacteria group bacterium]|nr:hypothetical protein [Patescibacteria group bacterium]